MKGSKEYYRFIICLNSYQRVIWDLRHFLTLTGKAFEAVSAFSIIAQYYLEPFALTLSFTERQWIRHSVKLQKVAKKLKKFCL